MNHHPAIDHSSIDYIATDHEVSSVHPHSNFLAGGHAAIGSATEPSEELVQVEVAPEERPTFRDDKARGRA